MLLMPGLEGWHATMRPCYDSICYSLWYHIGIILRHRLLPPRVHASSFISCCCHPPSTAYHPPPVIRCLLSSRNLPPNLVDCCCRHRPLSSHHSPPHRLTRRMVRCPPSVRQHCHHRHCCNPLLTPTALIALSVSHCLLSSRCLPAAVIVAMTHSLL